LNEERVVIRKRKLLIGEGKDEEHFFKALLQQLGLDEIQALGIGGKDRLREKLKGLKTDKNWRHVSSIGILRDADDDPDAAFQSVCDALDAAGLPVPKKVTRPAKEEGKPTIRVHDHSFLFKSGRPGRSVSEFSRERSGPRSV
jgi:hypothetical protein